MKTGYIITEKNYQYNDEYYRDEGGSKPIRVYMDRSEAEKEVKILEAKKLASIEYTSFATQENGVGNDDDKKFLAEYFRILKTNTGEPEHIVKARKVLNTDVRIKWTTGDLTVPGHEAECMSKIVTRNKATVTQNGKRIDIDYIAKCAEIVQQHDKYINNMDVWRKREQVDFRNISDKEMLILAPLCPFSFYDITPIDIKE